jgi:isoleucyl-tRNA synthetase
VVDGTGKAMHKSAGNVISPDELIKKYGAEIVRLWVSAEDYRDNIRLSDEILQRLTEAYRRIRNTCRFILGNLSDFSPQKDRLAYERMEELDRWALNRLQELNKRVLQAYADFEFHLVYHSLHNFCVLDLSSFYLDIIKDRLYTSPRESAARRSAQTAMHEILEALVRMMAPILSFTADEIWRHMAGDRPASVHADLFTQVDERYLDPDLASRWDEIIGVRKEVTKALEAARKEKKIGHSLDASVSLGLPPKLLDSLAPYEKQLRSLLIVSAVDLVSAEAMEADFESDSIQGLKVRVEPSSAPKCERCWVHDPLVGHDPGHPKICRRCAESLAEMEKAAN